MPQRELSPEEPVEEILSVWELTSRIKDLLEGAFPAVSVEGEISDFARPRSGHCYFTLKDDRAQIRAVIWRNTMGRIRFDLHDGLAVICRGHLDLYAPRGSYQLIVDHMEPQGIGALELAFRQLHEKLAKEGLFRPERKRPLPRFARRIAVVTSPTGAAIRDFLQVLARRWRGTDVLIVPARVQGAGSVEEVVAGIELVNRLRPAVDCLVVTRGGGSLEDLWTFNEERVVRAIHASQVPVVSAIGHEIDVTLSDLVADVRALTPSEAAELVAPAADEVLAALDQYRKRLLAALRSRASAAATRLDSLARHRAFRRPFDLVHDLARRLDELESRGNRAIEARMRATRQQLATATARLESLSPLAVLGRGYTLTHRTDDGRIVRSAAELTPGDSITTRFAEGTAISRVEGVSR
jgi:exodeoxyribonuclease VII large subunit